MRIIDARWVGIQTDFGILRNIVTGVRGKLLPAWMDGLELPGDWHLVRPRQTDPNPAIPKRVQFVRLEPRDDRPSPAAGSTFQWSGQTISRAIDGITTVRPGRPGKTTDRRGRQGLCQRRLRRRVPTRVRLLHSAT